MLYCKLIAEMFHLQQDDRVCINRCYVELSTREQPLKGSSLLHGADNSTVNYLAFPVPFVFYMTCRYTRNLILVSI